MSPHYESNTVYYQAASCWGIRRENRHATDEVAGYSLKTVQWRRLLNAFARRRRPVATQGTNFSFVLDHAAKLVLVRRVLPTLGALALCLFLITLLAFSGRNDLLMQ